MNLSPAQQNAILNLARAVIRRELGDSSCTVPPNDDPAFQQEAACFVTLHTRREHRLRGCIGLIRATGSLYDAVVEMSQAVLDDPRFRADPVRRPELPSLDIEVTVLSPMEPAKDPLDFEALNHGIYLRCEGESGLFLPQVARETRWSKEQLLAELCRQKMGLPEDAWKRPDVKLYRFTTYIIGPEPF